MNKLSRRHLLKALLAVAGGASLRQLAGDFTPTTQAQILDEYVYLPIILKNGSVAPTPTPTLTTTPPSGARVVHAYNSSATDWEYDSSYYGYHVNQFAVTTMVNNGVMALTGTATVAGAWQTLLSRVSPYLSGKRIAIKVNFNNSLGCGTTGTALDALYHPINAIISGLQAAGVSLNDIWVFDATRPLPSRFINGFTNKAQIHFLDSAGGSCGGVSVQAATWDSSESSAIVDFTAAGLANQRVPDILADLTTGATYVINVPILRGHGIAGVTLGFKHHMGCIDTPTALHNYIDETGVLAHPNSHPLLDLYRNSNIAGKTILTVGDGLFGHPWSNTFAPIPWDTFKSALGTDAPNSLFFATDPVAIDCVMSDFIKAEMGGLDAWKVHYLQLADAAGLGTFEQGDPWATPLGSGYSQIEYVRV
jgi:hypothetical protein